MKKVIASTDNYYIRELRKQLKAEGFTAREIREVISYINAGMSEDAAIQLVIDESLYKEDPYTDAELTQIALDEYPDLYRYLEDRMYEIAKDYIDIVPSWNMKTFLIQDSRNLRGKGIEVPSTDDELKNYIEEFVDENYYKIQDYYENK